MVLGGLRLAATDAARGRLDAARLGRLKGAVEGLVAELDRHDDRDPAAAQPVAPPSAERQPGGERASEALVGVAASSGRPAGTTVLCVAGRGPLDDVLCSILVQLLRKHGLNARAVPNEAASLGAIAGLGASDATTVCVGCLDPGSSPSHLRRLVRRVRERLPDRPILVGIWPPGEGAPEDEAARATVGADHCTGSLRAVLDACLEPVGHAADAGTAPGISAVTPGPV